jgi:hypothetical protein
MNGQDLLTRGEQGRNTPIGRERLHCLGPVAGAGGIGSPFICHDTG